MSTVPSCLLDIFRDDSEKAWVFVDGLYAYYTPKTLGFAIDWKTMRSIIGDAVNLIRCHYYSITLPQATSEGYDPIRPLIDYLTFNGYQTHAFGTENAHHTVSDIKPRLLVSMVLEILRAASYCDHIILFTGDASLVEAVEHVKSLGVRVTLIAQIAGSCSEELHRAADHVIDLSDLRPHITRAPAKSPAPRQA